MVLKTMIIFSLFFISSCSQNKNVFNDKLKFKEKEEWFVLNDNIDIALLQNIYFDFNSYEINFLAKQNLDLLVVKLNENKNEKIVLKGYADGIGGKEYNFNLALKRVENVKSYLLKNEIKEDRIEIISFGKVGEGRNRYNRKISIIIEE